MEPTVKNLKPKFIKEHPAEYYRDSIRFLIFRVLHLLPSSWVKNRMYRPERLALYHQLKQLLLTYIR